MRRFFGRRSRKAGLLPGTLVHVGERKIERVRISVMRYDPAGVEERTVEAVQELSPPPADREVTWINVDGIHDVDTIGRIGDQFRLHPLLLEDIVNTDNRPKVEGFDEYIFVVLKMLRYDSARSEVAIEQVSLVFGTNFVISFQESPGDVFDSTRQRIRNAKGRIRTLGADYLAYSLIDAVVDNYFIVEENLGEQIEDLEEEVVENPDAETVQHIHELRRQVLSLRRSVWPLREAIGALQRETSGLVQSSTMVHLRDVYDHTIAVIDTIENFRELLSGMLDVYLSTVSNRMNEVMKVLTVIATIFLPLSFIAGIYGMNFHYMPELAVRWAYPAVAGFMVALGVSMAICFRRKHWL